MLALATLVHNNTRNSTTGYAPNHLITGLEPTATPDHEEGSGNPLAEERVDQLRQQRILAHEALNRTANRHSPSENVFHLGQRVWLKAKNLALPYGSIKLAPRRHGPYPNHSGDLPSDVQASPSPTMDHTPYIPHVASYPIC
jgi:hypothetical protein